MTRTDSVRNQTGHRVWLFDLLELLMFQQTDKTKSWSKSIVAPDNKGPRDLGSMHHVHTMTHTHQKKKKLTKLIYKLRT